MLDDLAGIADDQQRELGQSVLFSRLSELDPPAAAALGLTLQPQPAPHVLASVVWQYASQDLAGATALVSDLPLSPVRASAWQALIKASVAAGPASMAWLVTQAAPSEKNQILTLLAHLAEGDPLSAVELLTEINNQHLRSRGLNVISRAWVKTDPEAALEFGQSLANPQEREHFLSAALEYLANTDPMRAITLAETQGAATLQWITSRVMTASGSNDPYQGLAIIDSVLNPDVRDEARIELFDAWANQDVEAAASAFEAMTDLSPRQEQRLAASVLTHLVGHNVEAALSLARRVNQDSLTGIWHRTPLMTTIALLGNHDMDYAWALAESELAGRKRQIVLGELTRVLADTDPREAIARLDQHPQSLFKQESLADVVQRWAGKDPSGAMQWLLSRPEASRQYLVQRASYSLANSDYQMVMDYLPELNPEEQTVFIPTLLDRMANYSLSAAESWLSQFQHLPGYPQWQGRLVNRLAQQDPEAAMAAVHEIADEGIARRTRREVAEEWGGRDPKALARWWHRQSDDQRDLAIIPRLMSNWSRYNVAAATRWAWRLRNEDERNAALAGLINTEALGEKENARLLLSIDNPVFRTDASFLPYATIARYDAQRARRWLASLQLDSQQQESVINRYEARNR